MYLNVFKKYPFDAVTSISFKDHHTVFLCSPKKQQQ